MNKPHHFFEDRSVGVSNAPVAQRDIDILAQHLVDIKYLLQQLVELAEKLAKEPAP